MLNLDPPKVRIKILSFVLMTALMFGLTGAKLEVGNLLLFMVLASSSIIFSGWLNIMPNNLNLNYKALFYFGWLTKEIIISSLSVIRIIWSSKSLRLKPCFEWVDTIQEDVNGVAIYSNSITLTPGTIALDIQGKFILVHALTARSIEELKAGDMDRRVKEIVAT